MRLAALAFLCALTTRATADCPKTPRLVFDPPGERHSLPQLTFDGTRYQLLGYDGPPTNLIVSSFDFARKQPTSTTVGSGGVAATATNGTQLAIAYLADGAIVARKSDDKVVRHGELEYILIDGRESFSPREKRGQSFVMVVDSAGKPVVKPIPLGDQRVMHTAPGVQIAWNPRDKEWGVVWSEFNRLVFGRLDKNGKLLSTAPVVIDGFVQASSRMVWTGTAFAFLASSPKGLVLYEATAAAVKPTPVAIEPGALEPVLAYASGTYAIAYRITKPGPRPARPSKSKIATDNEPSKQLPKQMTKEDFPGKPSQPFNQPPPIPDEYLLRLVTLTGGKASTPVTLASVSGGPLLETPVIQADGAQWVIAWGQRVGAAVGFDDRLWVTRVDGAGAQGKGYPHRLDSEEVHQGYASIAGTGCDLAISYVLGDPNGAVRVGVVRAP